MHETHLSQKLSLICSQLVALSVENGHEMCSSDMVKYSAFCIFDMQHVNMAHLRNA